MTISDRFRLWFRPTWVEVPVRMPEPEQYPLDVAWGRRAFAIDRADPKRWRRTLSEEARHWLSDEGIPHKLTWQGDRIAFARPVDALMFKLRFYEGS